MELPTPSVISNKEPAHSALVIDDDDDEPVSQEYLNDLLNKAKANLKAKSHSFPISSGATEEEVMPLDTEPTAEPLPPLDPGLSADRSYFDITSSASDVPTLVRDLGTEAVELANQKATIKPPELAPFEKTISKKRKNELRSATAGPGWFDLPAPAAADIPKLYREVEAMRMRNGMDPKRFYRRDPGEGKGIKGLPKYFAIGKVIDTPTPFNTASEDNLPKAERKRTLVEELVADSEARSYSKKKFKELQDIRGTRGRGTKYLKQKQRKW
ncbi:hypothetical protein FRC02_002966 [Tulasnella sp. 418]|nr:hypothetical protein FRC02_002966 [Tulasnella sp. 418]